jgi:hypothetical protein
MGRMSAPPNPSAKDVEKQDPVKLLLDKRKKLKLDKAQIAQLSTIGAKLREQNAPLYARVDSLHKTFRAPSGGGMRRGSDDDRAGMMENRQTLFATLQQVQEHNHAARTEAVALLKDAQKAKAYDLLEKQQQKSDALMRGPGGMEGGERGGGGRRRPTPAA